MLMPMRFALPLFAAAVAIASGLVAPSVRGQTIIDQWKSIDVPPAPPLKAVALDRSTTALLMLDFNEQTCNAQRRPRCIASIPKVKTLLSSARAAGVPVIFSLGGAAKPADIARDLAPAANEPVVSSGVDKFMGTELEKILKEKGIRTVIVVGTAAHGAVLYTASGAALRGMKVIVPVDGMSSDVVYAEQYVAWHLMNAPLIGAAVTLTTIDQVAF